MNDAAPWTISAGLHAAAIAGAAIFGATSIVDMEMRSQRGRTVVEIEASIAATTQAQPVTPPVRMRPVESKTPAQPQAQAVEIARRDPAEMPRPADMSTAEAVPLPALPNSPPATRVEIEADPSDAVPTSRPPTIERIAPVPQVDSAAVPAATGSSDADELPTVLANPQPAYPADAFAARIEGVVLLDVTVDAQGRVRDVTIAQTSGSVSLDHAALRTVRDTWRFSIYRLRGIATAYRREVPVRFRIAP